VAFSSADDKFSGWITILIRAGLSMYDSSVGALGDPGCREYGCVIYSGIDRRAIGRIAQKAPKLEGKMCLLFIASNSLPDRKQLVLTEGPQTC
jgi:hypothetical protein